MGERAKEPTALVARLDGACRRASVQVAQEAVELAFVGHGQKLAGKLHLFGLAERTAGFRRPLVLCELELLVLVLHTGLVDVMHGRLLVERG